MNFQAIHPRHPNRTWCVGHRVGCLAVPDLGVACACSGCTATGQWLLARRPVHIYTMHLNDDRLILERGDEAHPLNIQCDEVISPVPCTKIKAQIEARHGAFWLPLTKYRVSNGM